jgi:hypothetical protein
MPLPHGYSGPDCGGAGDWTALPTLSSGHHAATLRMVQDFTSIMHLGEIVRDDRFRLRYVRELSR